MGQSIAHRGPDDRGVYFDDANGLALGHNRLSIIDLSAAGHQPMFNEDRSLALVFNGEIYHVQSLCAADPGHLPIAHLRLTPHSGKAAAT